MISARATTGTGMLAIFCDLEPQWHQEFRAWLRDDMFPARMKIGFRASASYDLVKDAIDRCGIPEPFATVYETVSTGDLYGAPYQALRANRDQRDKDFHARFLKPARYTLGWVGPEISRTEKGGFSPLAVIDRLDLPEESVQEFNVWYMTQYLQRISRVPGILRVRRYLAMEGSPRHVMVHEFDGQVPLNDGNWTEARADLSKNVIPNAGRVTGTYRSVLSVAG